MNSGRNSSERSAINILRNLVNPKVDVSERYYDQAVNQYTKLVVDAAVKEIKKDLPLVPTFSEVLQASREEAEFDGAIKDIVKQLEKEGKQIPEPPTYER